MYYQILSLFLQLIMKAQNILEKHYKAYEKRIAYPDQVIAAMKEFANQEVEKRMLAFFSKHCKEYHETWDEFDITECVNKYQK